MRHNCALRTVTSTRDQSHTLCAPDSREANSSDDSATDHSAAVTLFHVHRPGGYITYYVTIGLLRIT